MLQGTTYWTDLFVRHFLFQNEATIDCDDLLFFVRKKHVKGSPRYLPKFEVIIVVFKNANENLISLIYVINVMILLNFFSD